MNESDRLLEKYDEAIVCYQKFLDPISTQNKPTPIHITGTNNYQRSQQTSTQLFAFRFLRNGFVARDDTWRHNH